MTTTHEKNKNENPFIYWTFKDGTKTRITSFEDFKDTTICRCINLINANIVYKDQPEIQKAWKKALKRELDRRHKLVRQRHPLKKLTQREKRMLETNIVL